ncbi:hypothetical protein DFJ43DRAFT_1223081 [Lentinula guzmanii]|uniref:Uncharacterized protein n=1 Tax=Lentinula guzmanii TaxID=2804957 RepID=A0AA38JPN5_9AGAR|nr:hypothetical protein DFJ43DRAFT_1223081 [Lentinula guzmanii]
MLRCPMTLIKASRGLLQFAHILIPNAMEPSHDLLTIYEWVLGMTFGSLCKQSRLFLLPVLTDIHACLNGHTCLVLLAQETLECMTTYFSLVSVQRARDTQTSYNRWHYARYVKANGAFANGQIYRYFLVPHPNTDPMILAHIHHPILAFYSHVSPFAFLLNAFHTLAVWSSPSDGFWGYIEPSDDDRSRVLYQGLCQHLASSPM